jgi:hypothetical protein
MEIENKKSEMKLENTRICRSCLLIFALFCLCSFVLAGCGRSQKAAVKEIPTENTQTSQTMQTAKNVLGQMHFEIEKADLQNGYIRTRPLAGGQFFEFWRSDNAGFDNQLLSNMHSIRRIVELNIGKQGEESKIECKVHVQRLSIPQREITSSSQAYNMFTRSDISYQRLELNPEQQKGMAWIELDRDKKLETEILKRISSAIEKKQRNTKSEG